MLARNILNYDGVGNRLTRVVGGTTETYAYAGAANRVATITAGANTRSFSYLASGQVSQDVRDASHTYTFAANDNGRNASAALNGTTAGAYLYNAFEQRVQKTVGSAVTQFVFDRFGHLLAEANGSGAAQKEYIWLDDVPVAVVDDSGAAPVLYFIHTDQLGTPQKITDAAAVDRLGRRVRPVRQPAIRRRRRRLEHLDLEQFHLGRRPVALQPALPRPIRRRRDRPQPELVPRLRSDHRAIYPERSDGVRGLARTPTSTSLAIR